MPNDRDRKPLILALDAHRVHASQMGAEQECPLSACRLLVEGFCSRSSDLERIDLALDEQDSVERHLCEAKDVSIDIGIARDFAVHAFEPGGRSTPCRTIEGCIVGGNSAY